MYAIIMDNHCALACTELLHLLWEPTQRLAEVTSNILLRCRPALEPTHRCLTRPSPEKAMGTRRKRNYVRIKTSRKKQTQTMQILDAAFLGSPFTLLKWAQLIPVTVNMLSPSGPLGWTGLDRNITDMLVECIFLFKLSSP